MKNLINRVHGFEKWKLSMSNFMYSGSKTFVHYPYKKYQHPFTFDTSWNTYWSVSRTLKIQYFGRSSCYIYDRDITWESGHLKHAVTFIKDL